MPRRVDDDDDDYEDDRDDEEDDYDDEDEDDEDDRRRPARNRSKKKQGGSAFVDFLLFRRMIAPFFIMAIFWLGAVLLIIAGLFMAVMGLIQGVGIGKLFIMLRGVAYMILGPFLLRLYCEILMLFFRMNDTLTDIKKKMDERD